MEKLQYNYSSGMKIQQAKNSIEIIFGLSHYFVILQSRVRIVLWCNGSTTDSGPVCPSSSLGKTTKKDYLITNCMKTMILNVYTNSNSLLLNL